MLTVLQQYKENMIVYLPNMLLFDITINLGITQKFRCFTKYRDRHRQIVFNNANNDLCLHCNVTENKELFLSS